MGVNGYLVNGGKPLFAPSGFDTTRLVGGKRLGPVCDVPNAFIGRAEIASPGTGFGFDAANIGTRQPGRVDRNGNCITNIIHASVVAADRVESDVEGFRWLGLEIDACIDIGVCKKLMLPSIQGHAEN